MTQCDCDEYQQLLRDYRRLSEAVATLRKLRAYDQADIPRLLDEIKRLRSENFQLKQVKTERL